MSNKIKLLHVEYLPKELDKGILYVSMEYNVAGHVCPCGCGSKVITPLGQGEWNFTETQGLPTLYPSIGNWQLPCRTHYWITEGEIEWSYQWTDAQIEEGRKMEERQRKRQYGKRKSRVREILVHLFPWLFND